MKILLFLSTLFLATCAYAQYQPIAIWQRQGAGDSSLYGETILALGDQNNDGFNDFAVYAAGLGYAPPGSSNAPIVEFFHGGNPPDTIPYMIRFANPATETPIRGARALGDLNGDGYIDWYIFTGYVEDTTGRHVYKIYFGGPGPHDVPDLVLTAPILSGYEPIGDFNGDGYDDLMLSGMGIPARIYYGGNPMDTLPDWQRTGDLAPGHFGDVNHDGFSDIVCYSNTTGYSGVFLGASSPDTVPAYNWPSITLDILHDVNGDGFDDLCFRRIGGQSLAWGGLALHYSEDAYMNYSCSGASPNYVVSAGDFNHDGYGDVVMYSEWCENNYGGALTLHMGHPWVDPVPAFVIYGWTNPLNLIHFKTAVDLGDVNGDHVDDLGIGANGGIEYAAQRGKAVVLSGDTSLHVATDPARPEIPRSLEVHVFPNPFNGETSIEIGLPVYARRIELRLCNVVGQLVFQTDVAANSDHITYQYNAASLATGLYFLHASSGSFNSTVKLMLLR